MKATLAASLGFCGGVAATITGLWVSGSGYPPNAFNGVTADERTSSNPVALDVALPMVGDESEQLAERVEPKEAAIRSDSVGAVEGSPPAVNTPTLRQAERPSLQGFGRRASADADMRTDPSSLRDGQLPLIDGLEIEGKTAEAHERMGAEDRNDSWAPYMEQQILTYLGTNPVLSQNFSIPVMTCRTTMCEIQAVGYGPNGSFQAFMNEAGPMLGQPWAAEFGGNMLVNTMAVAPGVQGTIVILRRESALRSAERVTARS